MSQAVEDRYFLYHTKLNCRKQEDRHDNSNHSGTLRLECHAVNVGCTVLQEIRNCGGWRTAAIARSARRRVGFVFADGVLAADTWLKRKGKWQIAAAQDNKVDCK
jgi:hypothetical protein